MSVGYEAGVKRALDLVAERSQELEVAQGRRDAAIRAAWKRRVPGTKIAEVAGISKSRVSQIVNAKP